MDKKTPFTFDVVDFVTSEQAALIAFSTIAQIVLTIILAYGFYTAEHLLVKIFYLILIAAVNFVLSIFCCLSAANYYRDYMLNSYEVSRRIHY